MARIARFALSELIGHGGLAYLGVLFWAASAAAEGLPYRVADLNRAPALIPPNGPFAVSSLQSLDKQVLFLAEREHEDSESYETQIEVGLWRSDGTIGGTRLLQVFDIDEDDEYLPEFVGAAGGYAFLAVGSELWASDGTPEGTRPLLPEAPTGGRKGRVGDGIHTLGGLLIFPRCAALFECELWASDGRPEGTRSLGVPAAVGYEAGAVRRWTRRHWPGALAERWHGARYRACSPTSAPVPATRRSGWPGRSPADTLSSSAGKAGLPRSGSPTSAPGGTHVLVGGYGLAWARLGRGLLVSSIDEEDRRPRLRRVDAEGSVVATFELPAFESAGSYPTGFLAMGDRVVFGACDNAGMSPFVSDGSETGTQRLGPGASFCADTAVREWVQLDAAVYYLAGGRLFRTDGTPDGTVELVDTRTGGYDLSFLRVAGERLLIFANAQEPPEAVRAFVSDGTAGGTQPLWQGRFGFLCKPNVIDEAVYFFASEADVSDGGWRFGLYRTDGSEAETSLVIDLGQNDEACEMSFAALGEKIFLAHESGLWRADEVGGRLQTVVPSPLAPPFFRARHLTAFGGSLFFLAAVEEFPQYPDPPAEYLFRSNGTATGTVLLARVGSFGYDPPPPELTAAGGALFFRATDAEHGDELWATDGTAGGTRLVADVVPGPRSSRPHALAAAGGRLFFAADDGEHGIEPWSTDGTAGGTRWLGDLAPGGQSSWPAGFTALGRLVFFSADDGRAGAEPWALELEP